MKKTIALLQAQLLRTYYKDFSKYSKGKKPEKKVAWVTSFTPVEILDALDIEFYYPESYAAVIAASEKEQPLIEESRKQFLSEDCCSYSCCFEGCVSLEEGPRGIPPLPDVLIATNNQCNTLPNWWSILAKRYNVPVIMLDYPGEFTDREDAYQYVLNQHKDLISRLEELTGNKLDEGKLKTSIENSQNSVQSWKETIALMRDRTVDPTALFDGISFLITSRCKPETAELYGMMKDKYQEHELADKALLPIFWIGYPLWYHPQRYLTEILDGCRIVGSNYITWWNLDYSGKDVWESLFNAYNYTFLNLRQETKTERLTALIKASGAVGAVTLRNKSCKCDYVSAKNVGIPQVELEMDMIDREYLDVEKARRQMDLLKETLAE